MNLSEQKRWVNVVFPHPPLQRFTYEVPDRFRRELSLGHRVLVPMGYRRMTGFVVDFISQPPLQDLREIEDILDPYPLLTQELLKLTHWVAEYYMSPWGEVIRTALPPGIQRKSRLIVKNVDGAASPEAVLSEVETTILSSVREREKISLQGLEKRLKRKGIRFNLSKLEKMGLVQTEHVLEEASVQIRSEWWVSLCEGFDPGVIKHLMRRAPKQTNVLMTLMKYGGEARRSDLDVDFTVLRRLKKNGYIDIWEEEVFRDTYRRLNVEPSRPVKLTEEQKRVLSRIEAELRKERFHVFLLHGVTGSGKTQVYIEAIRQVLNQGKTALVLIPEISLTPQAVLRYRGNFGDEVAVLHSRMSPGERYDSWRRIRGGNFRIGLGARSAVFAPLENLGLIVVDEEHENSYKQMDPAPRYHARDVAIVRGKLNDCAVILGSATPSLESYYNSLEGKYTLCQLNHRIDQIPLPHVTLVNLRDTEKDTESRVFSPLLREKIKEHLQKQEQVILLQNRRGFATFLRCGVCGTVEECPHCDITLTYHLKNRRLRCHYCGFQKAAPDICHNCGGATLHYRGVGTQRVEEDVRSLFPQARLFRMDLDTTKRKGAHDRIITEFEKGNGDVLLGTQMVAKGHDFPGVNLVGVISADTGLHFPDFRAGEKTFQLLTQAAGRAGRRNLRGEVVIQTFSPNTPVLQFSVSQDYIKFYRWESKQRKELNYPPWGRIIAVRFKGVKKERVAQAARMFSELVDLSNFFDRLGPVSAPLTRVKGMYRYHIIFKGKRILDPTGKKLRRRINQALILFHEKVRFHDVRVGVDVDPVDMM